MTEDVKPKRKRKRMKKRKSSPRTKGVRTISAASEALRTLWADPVRRAALLEKRAQVRCDRAARGETQTTRAGVPDGMRKPKADVLWAKARVKAEKTMAELKTAGLLNDADEMASEALQEALTVMRSPSTKQVKLQAAKLVLEYTKAKPAAKSEITVNKAEEWLAAVTADADNDDTDESGVNKDA